MLFLSPTFEAHSLHFNTFNWIKHQVPCHVVSDSIFHSKHLVCGVTKHSHVMMVPLYPWPEYGAGQHSSCSGYKHIRVLRCHRNYGKYGASKLRIPHKKEFHRKLSSTWLEKWSPAPSRGEKAYEILGCKGNKLLGWLGLTHLGPVLIVSHHVVNKKTS
jgi:hypothetical protein